ncbi:uncharacterized protein DS421_5g138340 [Arachis hypogaea]|nr:uncharacterized protein DS421_5g138340 [Arachis hypogaea]
MSNITLSNIVIVAVVVEKYILFVTSSRCRLPNIIQVQLYKVNLNNRLNFINTNAAAQSTASVTSKASNALQQSGPLKSDHPQGMPSKCAIFLPHDGVLARERNFSALMAFFGNYTRRSEIGWR